MTKLIDLGFALNYQNTNLLDMTPEEDTPTWGWLGPGITSIEGSGSDVTKERADYSTGGTTTENVTGRNKEYSVSGSRLIGDQVQEWLKSIEECVGPERETTYRVITPDGTIIEEPVTIKDPQITGPSGDSTDEQAISFTMKRRDTPTIVEAGTKKHLPNTITAEDVSVAVDETAEATPTVQPETAPDWCLYAIENTDIARVTADGKVTGIKAGKTRLSIKCAAKPSVRAVVNVTVTGN